MISKKKCENCAWYQRLDDHFQGGLCGVDDSSVRGSHRRCKFWKGIKYKRKNNSARIKQFIIEEKYDT